MRRNERNEFSIYLLDMFVELRTKAEVGGREKAKNLRENVWDYIEKRDICLN